MKQEQQSKIEAKAEEYKNRQLTHFIPENDKVAFGAGMKAVINNPSEYGLRSASDEEIEFDYDEDYDAEDDDDAEERAYEEDAERASNCKCGAWQFDKKGNVIHVADCCCGAD